MVRLDILINGDRVDALAAIVHMIVPIVISRTLAERLKNSSCAKDTIAIQAAIGNHVIARVSRLAFPSENNR